MPEERIQLKHPKKKQMPSIRMEHYEKMKEAITKALKGASLTHTALMKAVTSTLRGKFDGNISWYAEVVKLDLEARKILERTDTRPQAYRLIR